jgi:hypothetical protein
MTNQPVKISVPKQHWAAIAIALGDAGYKVSILSHPTRKTWDLEILWDFESPQEKSGISRIVKTTIQETGVKNGSI